MRDTGVRWYGTWYTGRSVEEDVSSEWLRSVDLATPCADDPCKVRLAQADTFQSTHLEAPFLFPHLIPQLPNFFNPVSRPWLRTPLPRCVPEDEIPASHKSAFDLDAARISPDPASHSLRTTVQRPPFLVQDLLPCPKVPDRPPLLDPNQAAPTWAVHTTPSRPSSGQSFNTCSPRRTPYPKDLHDQKHRL